LFNQARQLLYVVDPNVEHADVAFDVVGPRQEDAVALRIIEDVNPELRADSVFGKKLGQSSERVDVDVAVGQ
jgi:hypothetical protein